MVWRMATTHRLTVDGMTCEHCVRAVGDELGALDGVQSVDVELTSGAVSVRSATPLDERSIVEAVDEAGYRVAGGVVTAEDGA